MRIVHFLNLLKLVSTESKFLFLPFNVKISYFTLHSLNCKFNILMKILTARKQ